MVTDDLCARFLTHDQLSAFTALLSNWLQYQSLLRFLINVKINGLKETTIKFYLLLNQLKGWFSFELDYSYIKIFSSYRKCIKIKYLI